MSNRSALNYPTLISYVALIFPGSPMETFGMVLGCGRNSISTSINTCEVREYRIWSRLDSYRLG